MAGRQHRGYIIPQAVTQSSAPEDGQTNCPKHVELTGIIMLAPCSGIRGTYNREQTYLFIYEMPVKQNLI